MDYELEDYGFAYPWRYITDRNGFNTVFIHDPVHRNNVRSCFQTNLDSVYSIMMVTSVFVGADRSSLYQRAIDNGILAYHLE